MANVIGRIKNLVGKIRDRLKLLPKKFITRDPVIISPYRGYASKNRIYMKGRVLEDENIFTGEKERISRNLINTFKRFETDEIAHADVVINCKGQSFKCKTDTEGYFTLDEYWEAPLKKSENHWLEVNLVSSQGDHNGHGEIIAKGEVLLPSENADYGVITDIDDTILQTHVTSPFRLRMLYVTFMKSALKRLPVEGMAEIFQQFVRGSDGAKENPIFYISHSPWNIYDLLKAFLGYQNFPKGPILLRDYGWKPSGHYAHHKISSIAHILKTYPHLPFILLGDSAEEDTDFYIQTAKTFPNRIKAIYIRQTRNNKNAQRIKKLIEENADVNVVLIHSSKEISRHALENGLIPE